MRARFFFLSIFFLSILFLPLLPVDAAGLVPCGGDGQPRCTLCHVILGGKGLVDWGMRIMTIVALGLIMLSGIRYIVSIGNQKEMGAAKGMIFRTLGGFTLILIGWLVINTVILVLANDTLGVGIRKETWWKFTCDTSDGGTTTVATRPGGGSSAGVTRGVPSSSGTTNLRGEDATLPTIPSPSTGNESDGNTSNLSEDENSSIGNGAGGSDGSEGGASNEEPEPDPNAVVNGRCRFGATFLPQSNWPSNPCNSGTFAEQEKQWEWFTWVCQGKNGGTSEACIAADATQLYKTPAVVPPEAGKCGPANGKEFTPTNSSSPQMGLCDTGYFSRVRTLEFSTGETYYRWFCTGAGGGSIDLCGATKAK